MGAWFNYGCLLSCLLVCLFDIVVDWFVGCFNVFVWFGYVVVACFFLFCLIVL